MNEKNQNIKSLELKLIGLKIGAIYEHINMFINKDELENFIDYSKQFDAIFPLINPTAYMKMPNGMVDKARKRAKLLLNLLEE